MDYYSFTDPEGMEGWVGLVGWPITDALPTKWSHVNNGSSVDQGKSASYRPTSWPLSHGGIEGRNGNWGCALSLDMGDRRHGFETAIAWVPGGACHWKRWTGSNKDTVSIRHTAVRDWTGNQWR